VQNQNPVQNQTDAMTPNELLKCYYRMDTKRQTQLLAYAMERHTERRTAKRLLGRRHEHHRSTPQDRR
jgi:hypothetical protein